MDEGSGRRADDVRRRKRVNEKTSETKRASGSEASEQASEAVSPREVRARPGRRTVEERHRAVLELFAGKATVDQIAQRLGVLPATVEGWRQDALGGMEEALRRGTGKTGRELELERENEKLRKVVTTTAIEKCLLEQALETERQKRPTVPGRSRR
jgi:transposase-like protein